MGGWMEKDGKRKPRRIISEQTEKAEKQTEKGQIALVSVLIDAKKMFLNYKTIKQNGTQLNSKHLNKFCVNKIVVTKHKCFTFKLKF